MIGEPYARVGATDLTASYKLPRNLAPFTKKVYGYVLISPKTFDCLSWIGASCIGFQLDFAVSRPFTLFDFSPLLLQAHSNTYSLCVRWRYGATVHRYKIHSGDSEVALYAPDYTNQIVPRYWVLEFWTQRDHPQIIIDSAAVLKLSHRYYPNSCHDFADRLESSTVVADNELYLPLPLTIPFSFDPSNAWLSNGSGLTWGDTTVTMGDTTVLIGDEG